MSNEAYIKPHLLWHYGSTITEHDQLGRIVAAVCGQKVNLTTLEKVVVLGIQSEIDVFEVNVEKKRAEWRSKKEKQRKGVKDKNGKMSPNVHQLSPNVHQLSTSFSPMSPQTNQPTNQPTNCPVL